MQNFGNRRYAQKCTQNAGSNVLKEGIYDFQCHHSIETNIIIFHHIHDNSVLLVIGI